MMPLRAVGELAQPRRGLPLSCRSKTRHGPEQSLRRQRREAQALRLDLLMLPAVLGGPGVVAGQDVQVRRPLLMVGLGLRLRLLVLLGGQRLLVHRPLQFVEQGV